MRGGKCVMVIAHLQNAIGLFPCLCGQMIQTSSALRLNAAVVTCKVVVTDGPRLDASGKENSLRGSGSLWGFVRLARIKSPFFRSIPPRTCVAVCRSEIHAFEMGIMDSGSRRIAFVNASDSDLRRCSAKCETRLKNMKHGN